MTTGRTRVTRIPDYSGTLRRTTGTNLIDSGPTVRLESTCLDEVPGRHHSFSVRRYSRATMERMDGSYTDTLGRNYRYREFIPSGFRDPTSAGINPPAPFFSSPSEGALATQLLAETNPSNSAVDVANFVWELREIPDLVRVHGRTVLERLSEHNLRYQFGLKPLMRDVFSLFRFQELVEKRFRELRAMRDKGISRQRTFLHESGKRDLGDVTVQSNVAYIRYTGYNAWTVRRWGYVQWGFSPTGRGQSDGKLRQLARDSIVYKGLDPLVAWNALPWSWLVDWFGNIGDLVSLSRNSVGAFPANTAIMQKGLSSTLWKFKTGGTGFGPGVSTPDFSFLCETKSRKPSSASLDISIPLLTGRQTSILGSLAVMGSRSRIARS